MKNIFSIALASLCIFSVAPAWAAEQIEFPEEELATESVLPVFDETVVVRNRKVTVSNRFELGMGLGLNLLEPLYNNNVYNLSGAYHFDETNGMNVTAVFQGSGLSGNGEDLKNGKGIDSTFDASRAPSPENYLFANYQATAYYGKISVTKTKAMNLSLYGLLGLGLVSFTDSTEPALNIGFGQKLYFSKNFALRADFSVAGYNGPDPTKPKGLPLTTTNPSRNSDDFESTFYFRSFLTLGFVYLL